MYKEDVNDSINYKMFKVKNSRLNIIRANDTENPIP